MRGLFLASIIAFLAIGLYAQEKDTAQGEPKVNLKVVYEKTFDEPIVDVIFDTVTVSIGEAKKMGWKEEAFTEKDRTTGKVLISYPKVVFVAGGRGEGYWGWYTPNKGLQKRIKALRFYSKKGEPLRRLEIGKDSIEAVYLSPQKNYIIVSKTPWEYAASHTGGSLYDLEGRKIWEIEGPRSPIAVSDEGYAIAAYPDWQIPPEPGGDFYVYDSVGKLIATVKNPNPTTTSPLFAEYSKDGRHALLCFCREALPPTIFLLIDREGEILWKNELSEYMETHAIGGGSRDILSNIGIAGTAIKGEATFFAFLIDWAGDLKWLKPLNAWGAFITLFSQDGERVYICSNRGYIECFKREKGDIIWSHEEWMPKSRRPTSDVFKFSEMYEHSKYLVVREGLSTIFLFDNETGKLRAKIEYSDKIIYLSQHNGRIFVVDMKNREILGVHIEEE